MAPDGGRFARRATFPAADLEARDDPFALTLGGADLSDRGAAGEIEPDTAWELSWEPRLRPYAFVHPLVERAGVAQTELVLPHADLAISGTVRLGGRVLELDGARGGQAHLWGTRHAARWAWTHCNDLRGPDGEPRRGHVRRRRLGVRGAPGPRDRAEHAGRRRASAARTSPRPTRSRSSGPAAASG